MTKICIPISSTTFQESLTELAKIQNTDADIVEWWMGEVEALTAEQIEEFVNVAKMPVLVNCKDAMEKGNFVGDDDQKLTLLSAAAIAGAAYIDVDWQWSKIDVLKANCSDSSAQLILSSHSWKGTPGLPALTRIAQKMLDRGADMVKFAATPTTDKDVMTMMRLGLRLTEKTIPHICISMGQHGQITRRESPFLGNTMMFATLPGGASTAMGQYDVDELRKFFDLHKR